MRRQSTRALTSCTELAGARKGVSSSGLRSGRTTQVRSAWGINTKPRYRTGVFLLPPVVADAIAWLECEIFDRKTMFDHELFFARVMTVEGLRLREPPLAYSSRLGWRVAGDKAREPGVSVRDSLLARLADAGFDVDPEAGDDD